MRLFPHLALMSAGFIVALSSVVSASETELQSAAGRPECSTPRRAVKTLTDGGAAKLRSGTEEITVAQLVREPKRKVTGNTPRIGPVERSIFRVEAVLVEARRRADGDFQVVVGDLEAPSVTMIVKFPDPRCVRANTATERSRKRDMTEARQAFARSCGPPPKKVVQYPKAPRATFTGVGFFDISEGKAQRGASTNRIELHPVLSFKLASGDCQPSSSQI